MRCIPHLLVALEIQAPGVVEVCLPAFVIAAKLLADDRNSGQRRPIEDVLKEQYGDDGDQRGDHHGQPSPQGIDDCGYGRHCVTDRKWMLQSQSVSLTKDE